MRCNCPKPETLEEYQLFAAAAAGCLPGQCGSARGYVPPSAQLKADGASPWARQWCAGPANGASETQMADRWHIWHR